MTRWARSGNSQKHKKMPENPSTWEELSKNVKKEGNIKNKKIKIASNLDEIKGDSERKFNKKNKKKINKSKNLSFLTLEDKIENKLQKKSHEILEKDLSEKEWRETKKKRKKFVSQDSDFDAESSGKKVISNKKSKNMTNEFIKKDCGDISLKTDNSGEDDQINLISNNQVTEVSTEDLKNGKNIKGGNEKKSSKKEIFRKKILQNRLKNGIPLLPPKVEERIYQIKKRLRKKGYPGEQIKEIIRKERRKAEIEFYKSNKTCFNCREKGHVLSDCPMPINGSNPKTGICFKCGSLEHTSSRCQKRVSGYPFATCFICKTEGHISRDCPSNKHGVYPKGGACSLCDNVNHLRKDCPSIKKKEEEVTVTLHTIGEGKSIDEEIIDGETIKVGKKAKKMKVVKFQ